jgi:RNA polymerase sigma-70 factor (ECF subfamily)
MSKLPADFVASMFADTGDDLLRFLSSRLPNGEDARDLAQETYLRLLRRERNELVRHPEAYLFRIAANLIHEHWLRVKPEQDLLSNAVDPDWTESQQMSTEALVEQRQSLDALGRVIRVLPILQQKAVLMHRRDGMTYAEIAKKLDISPGMVKKYLSRGLARCREQLRRYSDE